MTLPFSAPMAEYFSSIFLPTFRVFEWDESSLTPWLVTHSQSVTMQDELPVGVEYDLVHVSRDPSYDYHRVRLSTSHVRPYGWLLLTLPMTSGVFCKIEQYLVNWTCVAVIPPFSVDYRTEILLRKPGQWTSYKEEVRI